MQIAIVGGGFTGLTAAYELAKKGHKVTVFEKDKTLGGLAHGFKQPNWEWHLESAYHHLFTNDHAILSLIKELGLQNKLIVTRPITANYATPQRSARVTRQQKNARGGVSFRSAVTALATWTQWRDSGLDLDGARTRHADQSACISAAGPAHIIQFDSPLHLLTYPGLSFMDKLRTGFLLASIKLNPFWQPFERMTAKQLFLTVGGARAWEAIWGPLITAKFGPYADSVAASWLWARIKKRTPSLCYIDGGFHTLVTALEKAITQRGGTILTGIPSQSIKIKKNCIYACGRNDKYNSFSRVPFDRLLLTVPTPVALQLVPQLPRSYYQLPSSIPHLHAHVLILETKEPILKDTYWLNITDRSFPFLAVVAHTNMIDSKHYGGHQITYFGNYLPDNHPYLSMTKQQLLKKFLPFIQRLNPRFNFKFQISNFKLFVGKYAQPVHECRYTQRAPKLTTPIPGVYLANLDSIYPWDRGTNYAVELGMKAAKKMFR